MMSGERAVGDHTPDTLSPLAAKSRVGYYRNIRRARTTMEKFVYGVPRIALVLLLIPPVTGALAVATLVAVFCIWRDRRHRVARGLPGLFPATEFPREPYTPEKTIVLLLLRTPAVNFPSEVFQLVPPTNR